MQISQVCFQRGDAETRRSRGETSVFSASSAGSAIEPVHSKVHRRHTSLQDRARSRPSTQRTKTILLFSAPDSASPRLRVEHRLVGLRQSLAKSQAGKAS